MSNLSTPAFKCSKRCRIIQYLDLSNCKCINHIIKT